MTDYAPSPKGYVAKQVALFEGTDGREGGTMRGKPIVVLTMVGRRSGAVRKVPLMRVEHEGSYAAVASLGGAPEHPIWYHNLIADPHLELQDGATRRRYLAREIEGTERAEWWERAVAAWPDYAAYARKTDRVIPVLLLEPQE